MKQRKRVANLPNKMKLNLCFGDTGTRILTFATINTQSTHPSNLDLQMCETERDRDGENRE